MREALAMGGAPVDDAFRDRARANLEAVPDRGGARRPAVNATIQAAAEDDIARHMERYKQQSPPPFAGRFLTAILASLDALAAAPGSGPSTAVSHSALDGLRSWPVRGFDAFQIFYLTAPERPSVLRVLHGRRDIGIVLDDPA